MANNRAYDSLEKHNLKWPYSPNSSALCEDDIWVDGLNAYVAWGGALRNRLGSVTLGSTVAVTVRPDRIWFYQTIEATPVTYFVGSFKNGSVWELRYQQLAPTPGNWTLATELRGSNHSQAAHEGCVRRGKLYIKGTPSASDDSSKLGSVVLDGTGGTMAVHFWGSLGPTVAAALTTPDGPAISAATNANPVEFTTATSHGYSTGQTKTINGGTGAWAAVNGTWVITVTAVNKFTIAVNSTGFGAVAGSLEVGWPASTHTVTVNYGWLYVYTYVQVSGHETNRSPLQTNPDLDPSSSGSFTNRLPTMVLTNPSNTTEHPYINVYRTTDGGGMFFFVKQIASTGAATQVFQDKYLASGASSSTFNDPYPDSALDTTKVSPTANSNGPPPTVAPPLVTGTDTIQPCTKIVEHQGRLWFALNEYVFASSNEELRQGVPEEAFASGVKEGTFFRFRSKGLFLESTSSGLVVVTRTGTARIPGTSKAGFNPTDFLIGTPGVGGAVGQSRASCGCGESVAWITQDYRLVIVTGDDYSPVSLPVGRSLKTLADAGALLELVYWAQDDKEWLIVMAHRTDNTALTQWLIYDLRMSRELKKDFWHPPWFVPSVSAAVGFASATDTENKLGVALWNGTNFQLVALDPTDTTKSDPTPGSVATTVGYSGYVTSALQSVPLGDHVNERREPYLSSAIAGFTIDRTRYSGDSDPTGTVWIDDFQNTPLSLGTPVEIPTRTASKGYKSLWYSGLEVERDAKHAAVKFAFTNDKKPFELLRIAWVWKPESGL